MFLNCDEFVEINLDLLATYLFTDFSKTFTNVLQITKFYKNHKKISQRGKLRAGQSWANQTSELGKLRAACRSFFCFSPNFSGKILDLRTSRLFFIFAHQCFVGAL